MINSEVVFLMSKNYVKKNSILVYKKNSDYKKIKNDIASLKISNKINYCVN